MPSWPLTWMMTWWWSTCHSLFSLSKSHLTRSHLASTAAMSEFEASLHRPIHSPLPCGAGRRCRRRSCGSLPSPPILPALGAAWWPSSCSTSIPGTPTRPPTPRTSMPARHSGPHEGTPCSWTRTSWRWRREKPSLCKPKSDCVCH